MRPQDAPRPVKVGVLLVAAALGALAAVGCVIAALFELDGFGRREGGPSVPYLVALGAGLVASVGVPLLLWRLLLPQQARPRAAAAVVAALVLLVVVVVLGIR